MRIQPDALIAGFPANRITELLRQSDEFLPCHDATKILGLDGDKARHLLERLHQEGFIDRNTDVPASAGRTDKASEWATSTNSSLKGGCAKIPASSHPSM